MFGTGTFFGEYISEGGVTSPGPADGETGTLRFDDDLGFEEDVLLVAAATDGLSPIANGMSEPTLAIDLAGLVPGSEHDVIDVGGGATLAGSLDVSLLDNFLPRVGDTFEILTAEGGVTGEFSSESLPGPFQWSVNYLPNSVIVEVTNVQYVPGDFDRNSAVRGADFLAWQRGESPNPFSATDLADWEANFGSAASGGIASLANVPEPATCVLLLAGTTVLLARLPHGALCGPRRREIRSPQSVLQRPIDSHARPHIRVGWLVGML